MTAPNFSGPPSKRGERVRLAGNLAAGLAALGLILGLACLAGDARLEPGAVLRREIRGHELHRYPVRLADGEFLRATLTQGGSRDGLDLALSLRDSRGEVLALADDPNGGLWDEEIAWVARPAGTYYLEVRRAGSPEGGYTLRAEALGRPAGREDSLRAQALGLDQSANRLMGDPAELPHQIELRSRAREIWKRLGERRREAEACFQIGSAWFSLGDDEKAVDHHREAARIWSAAGNREEQARAFYEMAKAERRRERLAEARQAFDRGLALATDPATRMFLLHGRGNLQTDLGDFLAGTRDLRASLVLARSLGNAWSEANTLNDLGFAYRSMGRWDDAIEHFRRARVIAHEGGFATIERSAQNSLGGVYGSLGDWDRAIEHYEQALELARGEGNLRAQAGILNNLALVHHRSLRIQRALELFQQALDLNQLDEDTEATALNNMAYVRLELGHSREALRLCEQSARLAPGNKETTAAILEAQAIAYLQLGQYDRSRQNLEQALALNEERNHRFRQASVTLVQGKLARAEEDLDAALDYARRAVAIVESFRTGVEDDSLRASFLASKRDPYDFYVDTLMALHDARPEEGFDAQSLHINEMSRARSLLDLLNQTVSPAGVTGGPAASPFPAPARPLTLAQIRSQVLGEDTLLLEYALGEKKSYLWAVTRSSLHVFPLPPKKEIEKTARSLYDQILVRTRPDLDDADRQRADEQAARLAAELSRVILGPAEGAGLLQDETKILVVSDGALQYIPFSALPRPSSPLAQPVLMVERHEIVHLPSASVLASLRAEPKQRAVPARTLALIADPVFAADDSRFRGKKADFQPTGLLGQFLGSRKPALRQGLARLHWSKEEANRIVRLVPRSEVFEARGFDASVARVTRAPLHQYRLLHFATHGLIDSTRPERSSLVLSLYTPDGKEQDGYLRLADVYNLRLNADLVVLSACQTALGKEMRGEGLIGLTRGFMLAGSRRVLASLWSVDDRVTAELMERLYEGMLNEGKSPAAALRQAQRDMLRDEKWKSPYHWAGFSLQGEWR